MTRALFVYILNNYYHVRFEKFPVGEMEGKQCILVIFVKRNMKPYIMA